jgi:hypothetical protein
MQRPRYFGLSLAFLLLLGVGGPSLGALEFGFEGRLGNLQFPWSGLVPYPGTGAFPDDNYFWGGAGFLILPLGEDASLKLNYETDPVLRNLAQALVLFERGPARIAVGPFVGFLNDTGSSLSAGLSTTVRFQWPGVAFISARNDGGLSLGLVPGAASEPQALAELAAGFYARNAIVSAAVSGRRFEATDAAGSLVADSLTRYLLSVDVYKKNVPYTLLLQIGYQVRSKYFGADSSTDSLGSLIAGIRLGVQVGSGITLTGDLSSAIFTFGGENLQGRSPQADAFLFQSSLGLTADTAQIAEGAARLRKEIDQRKAERAAKAEALGAAGTVAPTAGEAGVAPGTEAAAAAATTETAASPPSNAEEGKRAGGLILGAGAGLGYNFAPLPAGPFALLAALFNVRGGAWFEMRWPLGGGVSLGGEIGLHYITASLDGGATQLSIFDLPLRANAGWSSGSFTVQAFAGALGSGVLGGSTPGLAFAVEAGSRLRLGAFYLEGSWVQGFGGAGGYPRAGLGLIIDPATLLGSALGAKAAPPAAN